MLSAFDQVNSNDHLLGGLEVNKDFSFASDQQVKSGCRMVLIENIDIQLPAPTSLHGTNLMPEDRILLTNQTNPAENGCYVINSGAWVRASNLQALER